MLMIPVVVGMCMTCLQVVYLSSAAPVLAPPASSSGKKEKGAAAGKKKKGGGGGAPSTDVSQFFTSSLAGNLSALDESPDNALGGIFVLHGAAPAVAALKEPLCAAVQGRGGGRPGKLQGTASAVQRLRAVDNLIHAHFASL